VTDVDRVLSDRLDRLEALIALTRARAAGALVDPDLFGNGQDGNVTIAGPVAGFTGGDFLSFTLEATGSITAPVGQGMIIRATGTITIRGLVDTSGVVTPNLSALATGDSEQAQPGGAGGGGASATQPGQQAFQEGGGGGGGPELGYSTASPPSMGGVDGNGGSPPNGPGQAGTDATASGPVGTPLPWLLQTLRLPTWRVFVGGPAGLASSQGSQGGQGAFGTAPGGNGGPPGASAPGGLGGGSIILIAPTIVLDPAAVLDAHGLDGSNGQDGTGGGDAPGGSGGGGGGAGAASSGGQGGGGGLVYLLGFSISDPGPCVKNTSGGAGGAAGHGAPGGAGDGGAGAGGASGDGCVGTDGSEGVVFARVL
jgi:hypothetical protein